MTLRAPGSTSSRPTVPVPSTASTHSAAACNASRRMSIGTVPAWPASPMNATVAWLWPLIAVTTPSGSSSRSSTGPCSMWTSAYATRSSRAASAGSPGRTSFERDPVLVAQLGPVGVEAADDRRRPQIRGAEAQALLVGEAVQLDRALGDALDRGERDEHAERAVVAAGVAHGVQMRAEHERAADAAAADQVADRVLADVEPGGEHPATDELVGAPHRVGPVAAHEQAVLLAHLTERGAAFEHRGGVGQLPRYVL